MKKRNDMRFDPNKKAGDLRHSHKKKNLESESNELKKSP